MAKHHASVVVDAPIEQVYKLFSHFNDYPKFMSHVKEVTYLDSNTSHWVADVIGHHEWNAVNEDWVENSKIGWRSTDGLNNSGKVTFTSAGGNSTTVDVVVHYDPPAGALGDIGEVLGGGMVFEKALQHDLNHFAEMVRQAPPGALDPESSEYLFHADSAAGKGTTTPAQDATSTDCVGVRDAAVKQAERDYADHELHSEDGTASYGESSADGGANKELVGGAVESDRV